MGSQSPHILYKAYIYKAYNMPHALAQEEQLSDAGAWLGAEQTHDDDGGDEAIVKGRLQWGGEKRRVGQWQSTKVHPEVGLSGRGGSMLCTREVMGI